MLLVLLFTDYPGRLCNPLVCLHRRALHYNCHDSRELDANVVRSPMAEEKLVVPLKLADNVFPYILYIFIMRTRMSAR